MGSIDIIKPLSTVLSSTVNKCQLHQEKNLWECRESNPGCWVRGSSMVPLCYAASLIYVIFTISTTTSTSTTLLCWLLFAKILPFFVSIFLQFEPNSLNLFHHGVVVSQDFRSDASQWFDWYKFLSYSAHSLATGSTGSKHEMLTQESKTDCPIFTTIKKSKIVFERSHRIENNRLRRIAKKETDLFKIVLVSLRCPMSRWICWIFSCLRTI